MRQRDPVQGHPEIGFGLSPATNCRHCAVTTRFRGRTGQDAGIERLFRLSAQCAHCQVRHSGVRVIERPPGGRGCPACPRGVRSWEAAARRIQVSSSRRPRRMQAASRAHGQVSGRTSRARIRTSAGRIRGRPLLRRRRRRVFPLPESVYGGVACAGMVVPTEPQELRFFSVLGQCRLQFCQSRCRFLRVAVRAAASASAADFAGGAGRRQSSLLRERCPAGRTGRA